MTGMSNQPSFRPQPSQPSAIQRSSAASTDNPAGAATQDVTATARGVTSSSVQGCVLPALSRYTEAAAGKADWGQVSLPDACTNSLLLSWAATGSTMLLF
jgi:hypothetical protein